MELREYMAEIMDGEKTGIRLLSFRTDHLRSAQAQKVVTAIGNYNGFVPERVNKAIRALGSLATFEVAREYSPCLYVTVQGNDKPIAWKALKAAKPDELDAQHNGGTVVIRAWWD